MDTKEYIVKIWGGLIDLCREAGDIDGFDNFDDLRERPCRFNNESIDEMLGRLGDDSEKACRAWTDGIAATREGRHPIELKSDPLGPVLEELGFLAGRRLNLDRVKAEAFADWLTWTITGFNLPTGNGRVIALEKVASEILDHGTNAVIRAYQIPDFFDKFPPVIAAAVRCLLSEGT